MLLLVLLQEPGGRFRPFSEITGVCPRCKDQIDWKRRFFLFSVFFDDVALFLVLFIGKNGVFFVVSIYRYGKYKPLIEPAKW